MVGDARTNRARFGWQRYPFIRPLLFIHVEGVEGGKSLGPEQLQGLFSGHMLQLRLHLGLVFLVDSDWLLEYGSCLPDGNHKAVVSLRSSWLEYYIRLLVIRKSQLVQLSLNLRSTTLIIRIQAEYGAAGLQGLLGTNQHRLLVTLCLLFWKL